jgi:hypothetical protein
MDKGIGFNRNIKLAWLDAVAAFCTEMDDPAGIRARLEPIIAQDIKSPTNIRKSIDILLNIWFRDETTMTFLHQEALRLYRESLMPTDRLWLHYGLTLTTYPFFTMVAGVIGQLGRFEQAITSASVKKRVMAELGPLGSLDQAISRIFYSLRDWGLLVTAGKRHIYQPQYNLLTTGNPELEAWLLSCALHAHPAEELPIADLLNLPALFPFRFTVSAGYLRQTPNLAVQRQGLGMDMVRMSGG